MPTDTQSYSFASVAFANATPLSAYITAVAPTAHVRHEKPASLVSLLLKGDTDAALIPVVDLFKNPSLKMIDRIGISADGAVTSVLLKCDKPLDEVRTVAKDAASHTSNALAQLLLTNHFQSSARMLEPEDQRPTDARVVIGDRALLTPPAPAGDYDLCGEWKALTGLPFVFAVWACRVNHPKVKHLAAILTDALALGKNNIASIAEKEARRLSLPVAQCTDYLQNIIHFELGEAELKGMQTFRSMLQPE